MQIIRHERSTPPELRGPALAIGNFDGLHLGHQAVIREAQGLATQHDSPAMVMTFHPHPKRYFRPNAAAMAIEPLHVRLRRLRAMNLDGALVLPFGERLATMPAEQFVHQILVEALQVSHVVVGENFRFGQGRQGDVHLLQELASTYRFGVTYVPPVMRDGAPVSSSRVRRCLDEGKMEDAASLLGRPYQIFGRVQHGDKRGRTLSAPTANVALTGLHPPRYGVYAVEFAVVTSPDCTISPPHWQPGVANLGIRPTFTDDNTPRLEVHGLEPTGDLYGKYLRVRLITHLRDEQRFSDSDALKAQIGRDIARAQEHLSHYRNSA